MVEILLCLECKHYQDEQICKAFPDGIPIRVFCNDIIHDHPIDGDHGIQFEPIKKVTP